MTTGRWVFKGTGAGMVLWLVVLGLVSVVLALPVRRLAIPFLLLSLASLCMAFLAYWARSPVDQPTSPQTPRRFAVLMLALINIQVLAIFESAVFLGVVSQGTFVARYLPLLPPLSVLLAVGMYYYARTRVPAA